MEYITNESLNRCKAVANFNISYNNLVDVMDNETWKKSDIVEFKVKFNGKAVDSNEMDADELATSLLGMSSVLEEANTILNGQYSKTLVKVRGSFKPGSFEVDFATFFTSEGVNAFVNIAALVGFTTGWTARDTLIWLLRQTKGNKILEKKQTQNGKVEIKVENCVNPIIVNVETLTLYETTSVRKGLTNVVQPLKMEGMSDITFLENGKESEKILKKRIRLFFITRNRIY